MERTVENTRAGAPDVRLEGSYVDWPAVWGGAVVAIAVGSVFTGFGAALGLSIISAEPAEGNFNVMLIVSAVWIALSMVASYMAGGYIAGRMRRRFDEAAPDEVAARDGMNGLVVWGVGVIVSVLLVQAAVSASLSAAGSVASAVGSVAQTAATVAGNVAGGAAQGAAQAAGEEPIGGAGANPLAYIASALLRPAQVAAAPTPSTATADYSSDVGSILTNITVTGEISDAERSYLASAVAAQAGVPADQAAARVDEAVAASQKMRADAAAATEDAKQTAIDIAEAGRVSAILAAFFAAATALISAVAAHMGAVKGGAHRDEGRLFGGFAHHRRA